MQDQIKDFVVYSTIDMVDAFRKRLGDLERKEMEDNFSVIVSAILNSVTATIINTWAETVIDDQLPAAIYRKELDLAVNRMLAEINKGVLKYLDIRLDVPLTKKEVH